MMKTILYSALLISMAGCASNKPEYAAVSFEAGACFGTCPMFSMKIGENGAATYHATRFNEREGDFTAVIQKAQMDSLAQLLKEADLPGLEDKYSAPVTDMPTYNLSVSMNNGNTKVISDYGPRGPEKLKKVYQFIFSLRQSQDWKPVAAK